MIKIDLQGSWHLLLRSLELRSRSPLHIISLHTEASFSEQCLTVQGQITLPEGELDLLIQDSSGNTINREFCKADGNIFRCRIPLHNKLLLWLE